MIHLVLSQLNMLFRVNRFSLLLPHFWLLGTVSFRFWFFFRRNRLSIFWKRKRFNRIYLTFTMTSISIISNKWSNIIYSHIAKNVEKTVTNLKCYLRGTAVCSKSKCIRARMRSVSTKLA